ncbi:MAG: hypothetical protein IRY99_13655 [Isosphaeraceae bacterium]|nr:hypothetical protein [Isosphaeraceae bacterium]
MGTAIVLIAFGVLARLVPHPSNAVPLGALALYAGAKLPRRWALAVPLGALLLSDLALGDGSVRPFLHPTKLAIYVTYILIALAGRLRPGAASPAVRCGMAAGASVLFFVTTNFAVWATDDGTMYPPTSAGLAACYLAGIPFFRNNLMAELIGTGLLFGLFDPIACWIAARWAKRPALAANID